MTPHQYLQQLSHSIAKANKKRENSNRQAIDTALSSLCGLLPNNQLPTVLPRVVAIQAALAEGGLGQYTLAGLDRYLYGDE
jgi:hypothetical protein